MAGMRNIRNITIERHFGNTPDSVIWTEIARLCGYNVKFVDDKKDGRTSNNKNNTEVK